MSTSPDTSPLPADRLVSVLSHWLVGHVRTDELREEVAAMDTAELAPSQAEAVDELRAELSDSERHPGELTMLARETLHALVFDH